MIRKATEKDLCRIAEIIVFNNRVNYYPIFGDIRFSFGECNVLKIIDMLGNDEKFMSGCYVFDDEVIKGMVSVSDGEILKLYVDTFFQNRGIGSKLTDFAVDTLVADNLWALRKNEGALRFYRRHGFIPNGDEKLEEGTSEHLIQLIKSYDTEK